MKLREPAMLLEFPRRRSRRGEPYLGREGNRPGWYVYWYDKGRVRRRSARTDDRLEAEAVRDEIAREMSSGRRAAPEVTSWDGVVATMVERQRRSAKARGIPFDIDERYVLALMRAAGWVCSVSGVSFSTERGEFHKNPWAPSVDRIDNRQGYVRGNVRIVCLAVNLAMNEWGYDVLLRMSHGVVNSSFVTAKENEPPVG